MMTDIEETLRVVKLQRLSDEMAAAYRDQADWQGAYDDMVEASRALVTEIARLRAELTEARAACTCSPAFQRARRPKAEKETCDE